jgi:hypothetical protein
MHSLTELWCKYVYKPFWSLSVSLTSSCSGVRPATEIDKTNRMPEVSVYDCERALPFP